MLLERMETRNIPMVAHPMEQCMYCWYLLNTNQNYPEHWSSTCCSEHSTWIHTQLAHRRRMRARAGGQETRQGA